MARSINDTVQSGSSDDNKEHTKFNLNKYEFDLFHEEDNVVHKLIRIKRFFSSKTKEEKWKVFEDNKVALVLEGEKFTLKEKEYLRTVNGINLLLNHYKKNDMAISSIKKHIKLNIESK